MRVFVMMLLTGLIVGCASKTVPIPQESGIECERLANMTERVYVGRNSEEILAAATRLFQLTGGGYTVTRTDDGLKAHRVWPPVTPGKDAPNDGRDTWVLTVKEVKECRNVSDGYIIPVESAHVHGITVEYCDDDIVGIKLSVYHMPEIYAQGLMPTECFAAPASKPGVSRFTVTPALYELFFARMDHLLGKSARWTSCESAREDVRNNMYYSDQFSELNFRGHLDGLCVQVEDKTP